MTETDETDDTSYAETLQEESKADKVRSCTGLLTSYHGVAYQVQWLMLVALEAKNSEMVSGFTFRTEVDYKDTGKFDDVVWQYYCNEKQKFKYNFLQAKHKLYEKTETITIKDLLKKRTQDNPFGLTKYYISYKDSIKNNKKYKNGIISNLIIATNVDFDKDLKSILSPIDDVNSILNIIEIEQQNNNKQGNKLCPTCWKIDNEKLTNLNEENMLKIVESLEGTYDLMKLAKKLEEIIFNHQEFVLPSDLQVYNEFIYNNVFNHERNKISDDFIRNHNLSEETKFLREAFFYEAFVKKRKQLCVSEDCEGISDIDDFAKFIADKIVEAQSSRNNTVKLMMTKNRKDNINKLSNFVLIKKDGIKFNRKFWIQQKNIDKSLKKFRKNVITELKKCDILGTIDDNAEIADKLDIYRFEIANFTTCREHLIDEDSFWNMVEDYSCHLKELTRRNKDFLKLPICSINNIKKEIDGFFKLLVFAVNYTKKCLNLVVEKEMNKTFKCISNEFTAYAFRTEIAKALDLTENKFISTAAEVSQFFDKVEQQSNRLILLGPTIEYCTKIDSYNINFHPTTLTEKLQFFINKLQDLNSLKNSDATECKNLSNKQVLCIKTEQKILSSIKVFHILKNTATYNSSLCNYIFMRLESMIYLQDYVMQVFNNNVNLLVIECDVKGKQSDNVRKLYDKLLLILHSDIKKRIVLITHGDNFLTKRFKNELNDNYYEILDLELGLSSLDNNTQLDILQKGKVIFQGSELSIGKLVSDSKNLIDSQILCHLINNDKFEICNTLPCKKDFINFYIPRELISKKKVSTEIIKEQSNDLFAFSNTEEFDLLNIDLHYNNNNDNTLVRKIRKFSTINFKQETSFKFIILNESCEKNQIIQLCNAYNNQNIHWLVKKDDFFKWRKTKGVFTNLRPFLEADKYYKENSDSYMDDIQNEIINELKNDRIILIGAIPGMGKSIMLEHLVLNLKKKYPQIWIVAITLRKFRSELKKIDLNDEDSAMDFFYTAVGFKILQQNKDKHFHNTIMKWFKQKEDTKYLTEELKIKGIELLEIVTFKKKLHKCNEVYVFFDGFDEICPAYETRVTYLINVLKNTTSANIWITSRTNNIIDTLEDNLGAISYSIKPFGEKEQKLFLIKYWKSCLKVIEFNEKRCKVFIDELLTEFSKVINDTKRTFVGIPLQIYMLARNRLTMFQEFYESGVLELNTEYKIKIKKGLNLVSLYEDFIKIKFHEIRFKEKKHVWPSDDEDIENMMLAKQEEFLDEHQILALYALYANIDKLFPGLKDKALHLLPKYSTAKDENAIIDRVINTTIPLFVHQTYAEYFAALYLWKKFEVITLEEFHESFLPNMLNGLFFTDDRIQVCKFFYFIGDKRMKENVESIDLIQMEDKITLILKEILPIVESIYTSYESTGVGQSIGTDDLRQITCGEKKLFSKLYAIFKCNPGFVQVVKFIFCIVESYLEGRQADILEIISIYENDKCMNLLKIASETGCLNFVMKYVNKNDNNYKKCLKFSKWYYNPLWLAARNGYLDVVKHLSLIINHNWVDKDNLTLTQRAYWLPDVRVIRSCLAVNILDGNPYYDLNNSSVLPVAYAFECMWPIDIIQLLIDKTNVSVFNEFYVRRNLKASFVISIALLKYELSIAQLMMKKGFNFFGVINVLLFEFTETTLYGPIDKIILNKIFSPSFHTEQEYLMLYNLIDTFLRSGVGYNSFDEIQEENTIGHSTRIYHIHRLLQLLCTSNISKISPSKVLLKLIIDSVEDTHTIINYSGNLLLSNINETHSRYRHKTIITFVPSYCKNITKYLKQSTSVIITCLDNLKSYLEQAKTELKDFKTYSDRDLYNNVLIAYEEMLDFKYHFHYYEEDIPRKELYNSFFHDQHFEREILRWILNLYIKQDFEISDAFCEITKNIWRYKQLTTWIASKPELSTISYTEFSKNLDLHCVGSFESQSKDIMIEIIKNIIRSGGLNDLLEILNKISYIGEKSLIHVLRDMSKYGQISSQIFNLLNRLHESYKQVINALKSEESQNIKHVLKSIDKSYIKAVINGQDQEYGSPLHYAVFIGNLQLVKIFLEHGATPNQCLQYNSNLIAGTDNKYSKGSTALDIARREGHQDIVELFLNHDIESS